MKKNNKKCICCGEVYTFCTGCSEYDKYPRWMAIYHNENCKNLFNISSDFLAGELSKEEASTRLKDCDLSYKNKLHHSIVDAIDKIQKNDAIKTEAKKETKEVKHFVKKDNE
jgi:hypothetical protein